MLLTLLKTLTSGGGTTPPIDFDPDSWGQYVIPAEGRRYSGRSSSPYWRLTGPKAPWGPFDPEAVLVFPFDTSAWAASLGAGLTLASCQVVPDPLLHVDSGIVGQVVVVRVRAIDPTALVLGAFLPFRLRMTLSDGQRDIKTFYLYVRKG